MILEGLQSRSGGGKHTDRHDGGCDCSNSNFAVVGCGAEESWACDFHFDLCSMERNIVPSLYHSRNVGFA